jgi:hypothetical protein
VLRKRKWFELDVEIHEAGRFWGDIPIALVLYGFDPLCNSYTEFLPQGR